MKAKTDVDRKTIADLRTAVEASKEQQGLLKHVVGTLTLSVRMHEEACKKLEAEVARLKEVGKETATEHAKAQEWCQRLE